MSEKKEALNAAEAVKVTVDVMIDQIKSEKFLTDAMLNEICMAYGVVFGNFLRKFAEIKSKVDV